jgi:hypothetical protein
VDRAQKQITTHQVVLLGDTTLCFEKLSGGEPVVNDLHPKGNLPSQSTLFLGRGRELVEISRALAHPPAVIVLSGPPGIGKTSLVLEAAHRNAWRFPGGVAYAAGPRPEDIRTATAAEMLTALAGALGLEQTDDLARYTAAQPTLLLLDNLESLPPGELTRLGNFLRQLGGESAALLALRPSPKILEDLPAARPMPLHSGLAVGEAARYAMFLARQRQIPLTQEQARLIARAVDGHPLLVEQLVAQARRRDLDDLLREISERHGDLAALVETVYAWSASRLDEAGLAAWAALTLFPAGCAPEGPLRAAVGEAGLQNLRECALADFDAAGQVWRWHATVAEYALGHWPLSEEERRTRLVALLPAWIRWLERQQARESVTLNRLEESRPNLEAVLDACTGASYDDVWGFLDGLDACFARARTNVDPERAGGKSYESKDACAPGRRGSQASGLA